VLCQRIFSSVFRAVLYTLNCTVQIRVYGALKEDHDILSE
jgi:hypothetical protein